MAGRHTGMRLALGRRSAPATTTKTRRTGSGNRPQIAIRAACDGKRISPCRRVGSG